MAMLPSLVSELLKKSSWSTGTVSATDLKSHRALLQADVKKDATDAVKGGGCPTGWYGYTKLPERYISASRIAASAAEKATSLSRELRAIFSSEVDMLTVLSTMTVRMTRKASVVNRINPCWFFLHPAVFSFRLTVMIVSHSPSPLQRERVMRYCFAMFILN